MARTVLMLHHYATPTVPDYINLDTVVLFRRQMGSALATGGEPENAITLVTAAVQTIAGSVYGQMDYTVGERTHPEEYRVVEAWLERHVASPPQPRDAAGRFNSHE